MRRRIQFRKNADQSFRAPSFADRDQSRIRTTSAATTSAPNPSSSATAKSASLGVQSSGRRRALASRVGADASRAGALSVCFPSLLSEGIEDGGAGEGSADSTVTVP